MDDDPVPKPGKWGVQAHLKPILASPHYEVVAVCNSSAESSQASIEFHKLPKSVKAYGNPEDLAADPNVDLVVVSVNVAKHHVLSKPALLQGKNLYVEWPLGASLEESEELTSLAKAKGVKTAVGLQLRSDPLVAKVKELLKDGSIGRITSSVATGCSSVIPADAWLAEAAYYLDMKSGGNEYYIFFGHCMSLQLRLLQRQLTRIVLDTFTDVLGKFDSDTIQSILKTQTPAVPTLSMETGQVVNPAHPKTAPDHILVQGILESGAVASLAFRKAKKPADGLGLRWTITGTEGEIEVTIPEDHLQMAHEDRAIRLRMGRDEEVKTIDWRDAAEPDHVTKIARPGTNSARTYEAMVQENDRYASFESALETHKLLDKIARNAKFI